MKLYELSQQYRSLADAIDEAGGELTSEHEQQLAALTHGIDEKAKNITALIREQQTQADAIKLEADRLLTLARDRANTAARLKQYLLDELVTAGIDRLDVGIAKLSVRQASRPAIAWTGDGDIPEAFRRVRVELDGTAAYEAQRSNALPPGFIVSFSTFLMIR